MALFAAAAAVTVVIGLVSAYRIVPVYRPTWKQSTASLKQGFAIFLQRSSSSLTVAANTIILSFYASPVFVGYYAAGERITRAAIGLIAPLNQTFYPRLNYLHASNQAEAHRFARNAILTLLGLGAVLWLVLFATSPIATRVLFGPKLDAAIPVVRILALLAPLVAIGNAYSLMVLIPARKDVTVTVITFLGGVVNVGLAALFAPGYRHLGMAWAVVIAHAAMAILFYAGARRCRAAQSVGAVGTVAAQAA
jgi:PST family polysaccharide transporter